VEFFCPGQQGTLWRCESGEDNDQTNTPETTHPGFKAKVAIAAIKGRSKRWLSFRRQFDRPPPIRSTIVGRQQLEGGGCRCFLVPAASVGHASGGRT